MILVLIIVFISSSLCQDFCSYVTSCESCSRQSGCQWCGLGESGPSGSTPTGAPTPFPTIRLTDAPTFPPSPGITGAPSPAPTPFPPSLAPTPAPTVHPSCRGLTDCLSCTSQRSPRCYFCATGNPSDENVGVCVDSPTVTCPNPAISTCNDHVCCPVTLPPFNFRKRQEEPSGECVLRGSCMNRIFSTCPSEYDDTPVPTFFLSGPTPRPSPPTILSSGVSSPSSSTVPLIVALSVIALFLLVLLVMFLVVRHRRMQQRAGKSPASSLRRRSSSSGVARKGHSSRSVSRPRSQRTSLTVTGANGQGDSASFSLFGSDGSSSAPGYATGTQYSMQAPMQMMQQQPFLQQQQPQQQQQQFMFLTQQPQQGPQQTGTAYGSLGNDWKRAPLSHYKPATHNPALSTSSTIGDERYARAPARTSQVAPSEGSSIYGAPSEVGNVEYGHLELKHDL